MIVQLREDIQKGEESLTDVLHQIKEYEGGKYHLSKSFLGNEVMKAREHMLTLEN